MSKVIAGISVSLDGFIQDAEGSVDALYSDFGELKAAPSFQALTAQTGAVVMGRVVYEMADPFLWANDDYEFQVPIFVLTHSPPARFPAGNGRLSFTFVTEGPASAVALAQAAAGTKLVQVIGGASTIRQVLSEGLCDELQLDVMPVLLGSGLRLLDGLGGDQVRLERLSAEKTTTERTTLTFRVLRKDKA